MREAWVDFDCFIKRRECLFVAFSGAENESLVVPGRCKCRVIIDCAVKCLQCFLHFPGFGQRDSLQAFMYGFKCVNCGFFCTWCRCFSCIAVCFWSLHVGLEKENTRQSKDRRVLLTKSHEPAFKSVLQLYDYYRWLRRLFCFGPRQRGNRTAGTAVKCFCRR